MSPLEPFKPLGRIDFILVGLLELCDLRSISYMCVRLCVRFYGYVYFTVCAVRCDMKNIFFLFRFCKLLLFNDWNSRKKCWILYEFVSFLLFLAIVIVICLHNDRIGNLVCFAFDSLLRWFFLNYCICWNWINSIISWARTRYWITLCGIACNRFVFINIIYGTKMCFPFTLNVHRYHSICDRNSCTICYL